MRESTKRWLQDIRKTRQSQVERATCERARFAQEVLLPALRAKIPVASAWILGSVARREATEDSDLDVFVVMLPEGDRWTWQARQDAAGRARRIACQRGCPFGIDIIVWTAGEAAAAKAHADPFWETIESEGIRIYSDE
ncbi:MAG: nucleotidyltransferase family protein [Acidithiobacillus sp.]